MRQDKHGSGIPEDMLTELRKARTEAERMFAEHGVTDTATYWQVIASLERGEA